MTQRGIKRVRERVSERESKKESDRGVKSVELRFIKKGD